MKIVNLTGHPIRLGYSAEKMESDGQARVHGEMREVGGVVIDGPPSAILPILEVTENKIHGLPKPVKGTIYVVSGIVAAAANRDDVVAPARAQRDNNGRVTACHAFVRPRSKHD